MAEQESRVEYAVRAVKADGEVVVMTREPSKWHRGYWDRFEAENVRDYCIHEEGCQDAVLLSREVTIGAWSPAEWADRVNDALRRPDVVEAERIRKEREG